MDIPLLFLGYFTQTPYCFPMCFLLTVGPSVIEGINHSAFFHDVCVWLTQYSLWASWGWEPHLIHLYVKWIYCVPWHSKRLSNKGNRWHNKPFLPRFLWLSFCRWSLRQQLGRLNCHPDKLGIYQVPCFSHISFPTDVWIVKVTHYNNFSPSLSSIVLKQRHQSFCPCGGTLFVLCSSSDIFLPWDL